MKTKYCLQTTILQPRYNAPCYSAVSVITLTRDGPQFLAIKCIIREIKLGSLNNSVYLNLLRFKLLSRETETEHHTASNMVD